MIIFCLLCQLRTEEKAILGGRDIIILYELKVSQIRQQRQQKQQFIGALKRIMEFAKMLFDDSLQLRCLPAPVNV